MVRVGIGHIFIIDLTGSLYGKIVLQAVSNHDEGHVVIVDPRSEFGPVAFKGISGKENLRTDRTSLVGSRVSLQK